MGQGGCLLGPPQGAQLHDIPPFATYVLMRYCITGKCVRINTDDRNTPHAQKAVIKPLTVFVLLLLCLLTLDDS